MRQHHPYGPPEDRADSTAGQDQHGGYDDALLHEVADGDSDACHGEDRQLAIAVRVLRRRDRETAQPTTAINGRAKARMISTAHSAVVGSPLISMSWPPVIR